MEEATGNNWDSDDGTVDFFLECWISCSNAIFGIEVIKVLLRPYKNVCEFPVWMKIRVPQEVSKIIDISI